MSDPNPHLESPQINGRGEQPNEGGVSKTETSPFLSLSLLITEPELDETDLQSRHHRSRRRTKSHCRLRFERLLKFKSAVEANYTATV
jgi:hypothetical protein